MCRATNAVVCPVYSNSGRASVRRLTTNLCCTNQLAHARITAGRFDEVGTSNRHSCRTDYSILTAASAVASWPGARYPRVTCIVGGLVVPMDCRAAVITTLQRQNRNSTQSTKKPRTILTRLCAETGAVDPVQSISSAKASTERKSRTSQWCKEDQTVKPHSLSITIGNAFTATRI